MTAALYYIVRTLTWLVLLIVLLRFWLPLLRVDFRNPVAQGILRLTAPLVIPVRRFLPAIGRIDTATVLVAFVLQFLSLLLLQLLIHAPVNVLALAVSALIELAILSLYLFMFSIFIVVILSWFAPQVYSPVAAFFGALAEPVLRPFRRLIPPIGGLDISPIIALVLLQACVILLQSLQLARF